MTARSLTDDRTLRTGRFGELAPLLDFVGVAAKGFWYTTARGQNPG